MERNPAYDGEMGIFEGYGEYEEDDDLPPTQAERDAADQAFDNEQMY